MSKSIVCGEINRHDEWFGTPLELFKRAIVLSKKDNFCVKTNNAQVIEILEVLCGEQNIDFYICFNGINVKQDDVIDVYNYLGDLYNAVNSLRFQIELGDEVTDEDIEREIAEYEAKHEYYSEKTNPIIEDNFKEYIEILPEPKRIQAYQTDKIAVYKGRWGSVEVAQPGDWIIKYPDGEIARSSSLGRYKEVEDD